MMKKLLLILLCLPMIGLTQCTTNNATDCECLNSSDTDCDLFPDITVSLGAGLIMLKIDAIAKAINPIGAAAIN